MRSRFAESVPLEENLLANLVAASIAGRVMSLRATATKLILAGIAEMSAGYSDQIAFNLGRLVGRKYRFRSLGWVVIAIGMTIFRRARNFERGSSLPKGPI